MQIKHCMPRGFWDRMELAIHAAKKKGYSQTYISEMSGYKKHQLSNVMRDRSMPSILLIYELSRCSGYSIDWLMKGY